jgi:hypothetical protein
MDKYLSLINKDTKMKKAVKMAQSELEGNQTQAQF